MGVEATKDLRRFRLYAACLVHGCRIHGYPNILRKNLHTIR